MSIEKKLEKALVKKSFQDGVIQGIRLLSNSILEKGMEVDNFVLERLTDLTIKEVTKRFKDLEVSKQPQYIFAENRGAYIEHIKAREWTQAFYIYLYAPSQLRGIANPIIHYVGNYSNNPSYDSVRRMERERTFTNKVE